MNHTTTTREAEAASRAMLVVYWLVGLLLLFASLFGPPAFDGADPSPSFDAGSVDWSSADSGEGSPDAHLGASVDFVLRPGWQYSYLGLSGVVTNHTGRDVLRYAPKASPPMRLG